MGIIVSLGSRRPCAPHPPPPRWSSTGLALTLAGCSSGSGAGPSVAAGNAAACPGDVVEVVVSVGQWSDVVKKLGGDCATVTTVVASAAIDPHDFEPSVADIAAFSDADLVVLNGAGYDSWAADAVASLDSRPDRGRPRPTTTAAAPTTRTSGTSRTSSRRPRTPWPSP